MHHAREVRAECKLCGDEISSNTEFAEASCGCGAIGLRGGIDPQYRGLERMRNIRVRTQQRPSNDGWIAIADRVPTEDECALHNGYFLVWREDGSNRAEISRYDAHEEEHAYDHGWKYAWDYQITHWRPLPDAPI